MLWVPWYVWNATERRKQIDLAHGFHALKGACSLPAWFSGLSRWKENCPVTDGRSCKFGVVLENVESP